MGINLVVFEVCVLEAVSPTISKIELGKGEIVKTSFPLGVPRRGIPRPIVEPSTEILEGFEEDNTAFPPDKDYEKSETSKVPLPEFVLKTSSSNVTETIELSTAI